MTGRGTNTYLVGDAERTVIDPGPADPRHLEAVLAAGEGRIARVVTTHSHPDHAAAEGPLAGRTGAHRLTFARGLQDGQVLRVDGATLEVLHTPGHTPDHVCLLLREEGALFSGDLIMGGSTVVIVPPEGDMAAYLASIERLLMLPLTRVYPGHGEPIDTPEQTIDQYLRHRRMRERQILEALEDGPARIPELVARMYADVPAALHQMAAHSVYAHLLKLKAEGAAVGTDMKSPWRRS
jgi:glyoxylase-like metal-dependent hydrolase (beta-lactamase superfamily II)